MSSVECARSRTVASTMPGASEPAIDIGAPLVSWLVERALPVWSRTGVDRRSGGYFEKVDLSMRPIEEPRRARVVARQIYVFAVAARRGWLAGADALVEHGLRFLIERMRLPDGTYASAVRPDGTVVRGAFDLYEHAFVLFALAAARRGRPERESLRAEAERLLHRMRAGWAHPQGGFEEAAPRTLPLNANPHMHLLEAALAWAEISHGPSRRVWDELADEIVGLALAHFIDADTGALREHFDGDWQPMPGAQGCVVEPGHQFEWAWLLLRWSRLRQRDDATAAALRLLEIGEAHGVDPGRGVAINALGRALKVTDAAARLWPQTERIKGWHAALMRRHGSMSQQRLRDAVAGLSRFLLVSPTGLWREQMRADGSFVVEDCRASSLYHIVGAIDALHGEAGDPVQQSTGVPP